MAPKSKKRAKAPRPIYPFWSTRTLLAFSVLGGLTYSLLLTYQHQTKWSELQVDKQEKQQLLYQRELENQKLKQQVQLLEDDSYLLAYAKQALQAIEDGEVLFDINEETGSVTAISQTGDTAVVYDPTTPAVEAEDFNTEGSSVMEEIPEEPFTE